MRRLPGSPARGDFSGETQTLANSYLLQKDFYEGLLLKYLPPKLEWLDLMNRVYSDAPGIIGTMEKYTADSDPKKRYPQPHAPSAAFARVSISDLKEVSTVMAEFGLEFAISSRTLQYQVNVDEYDRLMTRTAYWLGDYVNQLVIQSFIHAQKGINRGTSGQKFYDRSVTKWSASTGANPVDDLLLLGVDLYNASVGYGLTDVFVNWENQLELRRWLVKLDVDFDSKKAIFGTPGDATMQDLFIPAAGCTVHGVKYGLAEGSILGLDRNARPATYYYGRNAMFSPPESMEMEDGTTVDNDLGLHTHKYFDNETHDTVLQIWLENGILVKDKMAGLYVPSGTYGI